MQAIITQLAKTNENTGANSDLFVKRMTLQKLPKFNGNFSEWPRFKAIYTQTSLEGEFSPAENATRLLEALQQPALNKVQAKLINPENVEDAFAYLELNYGNSTMVYRSLVQEVMLAKDPNNNKLYIEFATRVTNLVSNLKAMNLVAQCIDPRLVMDLVNKLPASQQEKWIDYAQTKDSNDVRVFEEFLNKRVKLLMQLPEVMHEERSTRRGNVHVQNDASRTRYVKCALCQSMSHPIDKCKEFETLNVDSRWSKVKELKLCFGCLGRASHRLSECRTARTCNLNGCNRSHHRMLHQNYVNSQSQRNMPNSNQTNYNYRQPEAQSNQRRDARAQQSSSQSQSNVTGANFNVVSKSGSSFMILPVIIYANNKSVLTYAFLDYGSEFTLMEASLAREMNLSGTPEPFAMICAKENIVHEDSSIRTSVRISGVSSNKSIYSLHNVRTVENLGLPSGTLNADEIKETYPQLKGLSLPTYHNAQPQILIGVDNPKLIAYSKIQECANQGPVAARTRLGWCVFGQTQTKSTKRNLGRTFMLKDATHNDDYLHDLVKNYFMLENLGVKSSAETRKSKEHQRANEIVDTTLKYIGGRYEVGLIWKKDQITLPDSYPMAYSRLKQLENKMKRDEDLTRWYVNLINEYVRKVYCHKILPEEVNIKSDRTWYIPHFATVNLNKIPVKRRHVFDAAARVGKTSLNTELIPGPNNYNSISAVIFKSRQGKICVAADIKEMFLQIKIRPVDQAALRFLWRGTDYHREPEVYAMSSMIFGASCSPYLAQEIKNRHALNFQDQCPKAVEAIIKQHFMDDYLNSHETVNDAVEVAKQVIEIHQNAGFNLRNFVSNNDQVLSLLPQAEEIVKEVFLNPMQHDVTEKILGTYWNVLNDTYEFKLNYNKITPAILSYTRPPTKRELLRIVMSIYDPIGLLSHALIRAKVIIQETWRSGISWDQPITPLLFTKWKEWFEKFKEIKDLKIPRAYSLKLSEPHQIELHTFCDASEAAYACVIYFRIEFEDHVEVVLVTSKSKVAPNKVISVPRLELQAALLGVRLADTVIKEHTVKITNKTYWSDSKTVLSWVTTSDPQRLSQFVGVRVGEIVDTSKTEEWRKIPTKINVADDATKWSADTTYLNSRWFSGPPFLYLPKREWPPVESYSLEVEEELKGPVYVLHHPPISFQAVPDANFLSFIKTRAVIAYIIKFVRSCQVKTDKMIRQKTLNKLRLKKINLPILSVLEIEDAERLMIRKAQFDSFQTEYTALWNNQTLPAKSKLVPLTPIMDDSNIIRINSRIKATPKVSRSVIMPAILPNKHAITNMIVRHHHVKFAHQLQETVIASIRKNYWIINIRSAVRRVKSQCQFCKIRRARPVPPMMGELPKCRLDHGQKPFTHTGMDFFGPLEVSIFRRKVKRYVMIFACMVTRAVYLELACSLSTDSCILNLRNFLNRHGPVKHIYCDNGTNFHGAHNELRHQLEAMNSKLASTNNDYYISWHFNPPAASNFGGAYERLIQSVQRVLAVILREQAPQEETLRSALIECENIVNSRPLTHVPIECEDDEPLTPNHFLKLHQNCLPEPCDVNNVNLRKQWRIAQQITNNFWRRWLNEYLPELARRTKWYSQAPNINVGDIVLIVDNNAPRNQWRRGKIEKLYYGPDEIARVAIVNSKAKLYKRPLSKLAKLDLS
jgi:hypothetical protein